MLAARRYLATIPALLMAAGLGVLRPAPPALGHERNPGPPPGPLTGLPGPAGALDRSALALPAAGGQTGPDWQALAFAAIRRSEYHIRYQEQAGALQSPNRAQDLRITYRTDGFSLTPRVDGEAWHTGLRLTSIGRAAQRFTPVAMPAITVQDSSATVDHGPFVLHYANDEHGMRQDFVVHQRPRGDGPLEVRLHYEGSLHATAQGEDDILFSAYDTTTNAFTPCVWYRDLLAWDADGDTLEARASVEEDAIVLTVEDAWARYPITVDPLSTTVNWQREGDQATAYYGASLGTAGDVNGDGYSDVVVGAWAYDHGQADEGVAYVYLGSATGLSTTPHLLCEGNLANRAFGYSVSTAGDVNGDGYSDVAIIEEGTSISYGRLFIYFGSATGLSQANVSIMGLPGGLQGWNVACAGDVNADGYSDIILGQPYYYGSSADQGRAYIYLGSAAGLQAAPQRTLTGTQYDAKLGADVASAGDVNGDGYSDIVIGQPLWSNGSSYEGRVLVFFGSAAGIGATASWTFEPNENGWGFGISVACAGDVNGDGYSDVIAGGSTFNSFRGAAAIFHGSAGGLSPVMNWSKAGAAYNYEFGASVACAGDVNGDGYADVVVGAPAADGSFTDEGAAYVFLGSSSGVSATAAWSKAGGKANSNYGNAAATAGDVNGDGYSDLLVGAWRYDNGQTDEGRAYLYQGSPEGLGTTASVYTGAQALADFGSSVSTAGDVNGDGYGDVIIGAPFYDNGQAEEGRAFLYLGTATGPGSTAAWTGESDMAGAEFGYSVSTAGDVNGDGYSDVVIGAPVYDAAMGGAFVYLGGSAGLATAPAATPEGDQLSFLGFSVNTAGDVNGDGYSDVVIGAPYYSPASLAYAGAAFVYYGEASGMGATPTPIHGTQANAHLGSCVAGGGDVDGDGYDDVLLGAPNYQGTFPAEGQALAYAGSPTGVQGTPLWTATGGKANSSFGTAVAMAGDVDANGLADVIVGAPYYDVATSTSNEGRACVFLSGPGGPAATPAWVVEGNNASASFGYAVSMAGDVNGDGYGDVLVGEPGYNGTRGRLHVYHGTSTGPSATPALTLTGSQAGQRFGASVSNAGSLRGNGYGDVLVGSPWYDPSAANSSEGRAYLYSGNGGRAIFERTRQYRPDLATPVQPGNGTFDGTCGWGIGQQARSPIGRRRVKLVWEIKGHGASFSSAGGSVNTSVAFTGQSAAWTNVAGAYGLPEIKQALTTSMTAYPAWRVRLRNDPATMIDGQPFGRWHYFGINDRQGPAVKTTTPNCGPLPVELTAFDAACVDGGMTLTWTTASEHNSSHFTVQCSSDGSTWTDIGRVEAAGNSQQFLAYSFTDPAPPGGQVLYYRLRQVDLDGAAKVYDAVVAFPCAMEDAALAAFPNPATEEVYVSLPGGTGNGPLLLNLLDGQGRIVRAVPLPSGDRARFDLHGLAPGVYTITLAGTSALALRPARVIKQ